MTDGRRDRAWLAAWILSAFVLSSLRDIWFLGTLMMVSLVLFRRGALQNLARTLRSVVPITLGLSLFSIFVLRLLSAGWPDLQPFASLVLRATVIAFVTFSVLERVRLLHAFLPFPTLSRLLVITLGQIHALRLVATESRDGLRSRMARRPGAIDVVRNAGGIAATLFALSTRNARDITDAMRSRGF